jgi:hypothetical protein
LGNTAFTAAFSAMIAMRLDAHALPQGAELADAGASRAGRLTAVAVVAAQGEGNNIG